VGGALGEDGFCHWADYNYPPQAEHDTPRFVLNLDLPPEERWVEIATTYRAGIRAAVDQLFAVVGKISREIIDALMELDEDRVLKLLGKEYAGEIKGLRRGANLTLAEATLVQINYEVGGLGCTSIVAQNEQGEVIHGRNMDFGVFLGYSFKNDTWELTTKLRDILITVEAKKGGVSLYNSTTYAGLLGVVSVSKANGFSLSVDSRQGKNNALAWLLGKYQGLELALGLRTAMTDNATFADGLAFLQTVPFAMPAYIIIGGTQPGEGAVITRDPETTVNTWTLADTAPGGMFYVLETNYDHWKPTPFFDNRRTPAERCLNTTTAAGLTFPQMYNILQAQPTRNQLTVMSVVMQPGIGRHEGYKTWCPAPCTPW